jgi:hypothetical protein
MMLLRLLGIGLAYGLGFMFVKSLFPEPFVLLILQGGQSSEGDLTALALVYMGVGLLGGLIAAPLFGAAVLPGRARREGQGSRPVLSLAFALLTGLISGILTLIVYATGILPPGGVLDPLLLIRDANHPTGIPLLYAWSIARDLLPAGSSSPPCSAAHSNTSTPQRRPLSRKLTGGKTPDRGFRLQVAGLFGGILRLRARTSKRGGE